MKWGWLFFYRNSREGLLEFRFGENKKESCGWKFPVTINHENAELFRIVRVNSTAQKVCRQCFFARVLLVMLHLYIFRGLLVLLVSGYVYVTLETVCLLLHTRLAIWIHVNLVRCEWKHVVTGFYTTLSSRSLTGPTLQLFSCHITPIELHGQFAELDRLELVISC